MDFSEALKLMKKGEFVKREEWGKNDLYIAVITKSETDETTGKEKSQSFKMIKQRNTISGDSVVWMGNHVDILSEDWIKSKKEITEDKK